MNDYGYNDGINTSWLASVIACVPLSMPPSDDSNVPHRSICTTHVPRTKYIHVQLHITVEGEALHYNRQSVIGLSIPIPFLLLQ